MRALSCRFSRLVWFLCLCLPSAIATADVLETIGRTIVKEPMYDSAPRYVLLVFDEKAEERVWIVEDGERLYVDKNGNGDLTDDGAPLTPTGRRQLGTTGWDYHYLLEEFTLLNGTRHTDLRLARWNYGANEDGYGLSLTLNGSTPMYAGWTSFWASSPAEASVIHFGGRLQPRMLRFKDFAVGSGPRRLSLAFINPGLGDGAHARLSIDALDAAVVPVVHIEWPVGEDRAPLRTSHQLAERCCYWEFYTTDFQVPDSAAAGTATVTVSMPFAIFPAELKTDRLEVPVTVDEE